MPSGDGALGEPDGWRDLPVRERERREWVLREIARRIAVDGPHRALPGPERGRLFMPFAALKGFSEAIGEIERNGA